MMTLTEKTLYFGIPTIAAVGLATAVVMGKAPASREATLATGTAFVAGLEHSVSTVTAVPGDAVEARTVVPVTLDDGAAIPPGAVLRGEVVEARSGGRIAGAPELTLRFTSLEVDGETYDISAEPLHLTGKSDAGESAAQIGGGAVAGGVLGAVIGGGDDVVEGAIVGAAIGTGVAVATKGGDIVLGVGQQLRIRLREPVTVRYRPAPESEARPVEQS